MSKSKAVTVIPSVSSPPRSSEVLEMLKVVAGAPLLQLMLFIVLLEMLEETGIISPVMKTSVLAVVLTGDVISKLASSGVLDSLIGKFIK